MIGTAIIVAYAIGVGTEVIPRMLAKLPLEELWQPVVALVTLMGILALILGFKFYVRRKPLAPITFFADHITLPVDAESNRIHAVPYEQIVSLTLRGPPPSMQLSIETKKHVYPFALDIFAEPGGIEQVIERLRSRISQLPSGPAMLAQMQNQKQTAEVALMIRPVVIQVLLALFAIFFANEHLTHALDTPMGAVGWGANAPALVLKGEYFRLSASTFLHAGIFECLLCCIAIYFIGSIVERLLGHFAVLLIFLVSAWLSALVVAKFSTGLVFMGGWGALYGLFGAFSVLHIQKRVTLPPGFRQPWRFWANTLFLSALLPILVYSLHPLMQISGFLVGATLSLLLMPREFPVRKTTVGTRAAAITFTALFAFQLAHTVRYAAKFDSDVELSAAKTIVEAPRVSAVDLNNFAWLWSIDPKTPSTLQKLALETATRATLLDPKQSAYRDTLATAHYRLGDYDDAVGLARGILEESNRQFAASQFMRFLQARYKAEGVIASSRQHPQDVTLQLDGQTLTVQLKQPVKHPLTIYALGMQGHDLMGLVRVVLAPTSEKQLHLDIDKTSLRKRDTVLPETLTLAAIYDLPERELANSAWHYWMMDPNAKTLP
jgi:membrane associated rhomboid family serine protease